MLGRVLTADDDEGRVYWGRKQADVPVCVDYDPTLLAANPGVVPVWCDGELAAVEIGESAKAHGGVLFVGVEPILLRLHVLVWRNDDTSDVTSATLS